MHKPWSQTPCALCILLTEDNSLSPCTRFWWQLLLKSVPSKEEWSITPASSTPCHKISPNQVGNVSFLQTMWLHWRLEAHLLSEDGTVVPWATKTRLWISYPT